MQTKNKAYNLSSYAFSMGEKILVDANVWIYLYPPPSNPHQHFAAGYSKAFEKLIAAHAIPILNPLILSEYLNTYIRIKWQGHYQYKYRKFKDFRASPDFAEKLAPAAKHSANRIINLCEIQAVPTDELYLQQALSYFSTGKTDFNDAIFTCICQTEKFKLMTNDADFQNHGIELLTTNPKLLRSFP